MLANGQAGNPEITEKGADYDTDVYKRQTQDSVGHGNQKVCSVLETRILVEIGTQEETGEGSIFRAEIPVGQYSDYQVFPTCGISTTKKMIGEVEDVYKRQILF